jgi:hypothetical protein
MLYSLVITYMEDDFVIQSEAVSPDEAIKRGIRPGEGERIRIFDSGQIDELRREVATSTTFKCVPIEGLTNVRNTCCLVEGELVQFHVIATEDRST